MISVILPTKNEEQNIGILISQLSDILEGYTFEIIVIDAQSTDKTVDVAKSFADKGFSVRVFTSSARKGLAYDTYLGIQCASYPLIAVMDTDLQHDPHYLPSLMEKILSDHEIQMVIGSRYVPGGGLGDWLLYRKILSVVAITLAKFITGVSDTMTQYYIIRKEEVEKMNLSPIGMRLSLYFITRLTNISEVPIIFKRRIHGETTQTLKTYSTDFFFIFSVYITRLKSILGVKRDNQKNSVESNLAQYIKEL